MTIVNAGFVNVIFFNDEIHIFEMRSTMNTGRKNKWLPYKNSESHRDEDMNHHVLFSNSDGVSQCIDQIKRFNGSTKIILLKLFVGQIFWVQLL